MQINESFNLVFLLGGILGVIGLALAPIIYLAARQEKRKADMEHAERMKALELGLPVPATQVDKIMEAANPKKAPESLSRSMTVSMPLSALGIALGANVVLGPQPWAWAAAGAISVAGVIGGTVIALRHPQTALADHDSAPLASEKPEMSPDLEISDLIGSQL